MIGLVQQVMKQAKARVLCGEAHFPNKLVSVFETDTEVIKKGKASKPVEFGKMVKIQEAENQIITHYEVFPAKPNDGDLLLDSIEKHRQRLGRTPDLVAADAGFSTLANEISAETLGVKRVAIPRRGKVSAKRRQVQRERWFRRGQKWRTGAEGRISLLKRRHKLNRCLYRGPDGMQRWVGFGVIADTLINMGRVLVAPAPQ